jgi:hypothetical protein
MGNFESSASHASSGVLACQWLAAHSTGQWSFIVEHTNVRIADVMKKLSKKMRIVGTG